MEELTQPSTNRGNRAWGLVRLIVMVDLSINNPCMVLVKTFLVQSL